MIKGILGIALSLDLDIFAKGTYVPADVHRRFREVDMTRFDRHGVVPSDDTSGSSCSVSYSSGAVACRATETSPSSQ